MVVAPAVPTTRDHDRVADNLGLAGASYVGTGTPTGTKRGESLLWWNDGIWWANMWDSATEDFYIFQLEPESQTWVRTATAVDWRPNTHADVLWTGTKLYIASHRFVDDKEAAQYGHSSFLFRYSYDPVAKEIFARHRLPQRNQLLHDGVVGHRPGLHRRAVGDLAAERRNLREPDRRNGRRMGEPVPMPGGNVTLDDTSAVSRSATGCS